MDEVTIRDLRNAGGEVMQRVENGESLTVTRSGVAVGELRPLPKPRVSASALVARWRGVPAVDGETFRSDVDAGPDPAL